MVRSHARPETQPEPRPAKGGQQAGRAVGRVQAEGAADPAIILDLPATLSPTKAEIALLRAFLADEIDAILRSGD